MLRTCCSYLALVAALASEADYVFIPEDPAPSNWPIKLCSKLSQVLVFQNYQTLCFYILFFVVF